MGSTVRLTVAQATVRFLGQQWTERDGQRQRLFAGCFGIFCEPGDRPGDQPDMRWACGRVLASA